MVKAKLLEKKATMNEMLKDSSLYKTNTGFFGIINASPQILL